MGEKTFLGHTGNFDGEDITHPDKPALKRLRRRMQMVYQDPFGALNPRMKVLDIVGEPLRVLIDKKPAQIEVSSRFDMKVYYGDGTRIDLLRRSGADEARLIAFCIDDPSLDSRALQPIAEAFPQAAIMVRAFDRRQVLALKDIDLAGVVREVYESAICMGVQAMETLGVPPKEVEEVERQYRENDDQRMALQIEHGTLLAAKDLMYRPGNSMRLLSRGDGDGA